MRSFLQPVIVSGRHFRRRAFRWVNDKLNRGELDIVHDMFGHLNVTQIKLLPLIKKNLARELEKILRFLESRTRFRPDEQEERIRCTVKVSCQL